MKNISMNFWAAACLLVLCGCGSAGRRAGKGCPEGMLAYWNFNEKPEAGRPPEFLNGPAWYSEGRAGSGLEMQNSGYALFQHLTALDSLEKVTVEAWIKYRTLDHSNSGARVFCKGPSACLTIGGPGNSVNNLSVFVDGTSPADWRRGYASVTPDEWHHVAFTFDGARIKIYLDGRLDAALAAPGRMVNDPAKPGIIGWDPYAVVGYHSPLDGYIDEVAVYGRPLPAEELEAHYRLGLKGKGYCAD
ncbi:MAG: hypothetical protein A2049_05825 [Elusimicrobia bacterium GWA2_62_23]|nr:MAG: hypothetical protein A2049_05825 [Elusimicrobia bacterium GWA2_62_23]